MQSLFSSFEDHRPELCSITNGIDVSCSAFKNKFSIILLHELQALLFQLNIVPEFVRLFLSGCEYSFTKNNLLSYIIVLHLLHIRYYIFITFYIYYNLLSFVFFWQF